MAAPKLYNWQSKQWDIVPDHMVTDGIANGAYSFEHGIDVPVVAPDGSLGSVPSQNVQEAFQNGYRWQTDADQKANNEQQQQAISDEHYDSASDAFIGGVVEGGIPGAVPIMKGIASATGHDPNAITEGMNQLREHSPTASFAGNLAGAVASPITEALGGAANAVGAKLATGAIDSGFGAAAMHAPELAARLAGKGLVGTAANIVDDFAPKIVGGAFEGAYFGLHDGINEAALGDPDHAAQTIMSQVGDGLLFGGAGGAVVEGLSKAATPIKSMLSDGISALSNASQKAAEAATKGATLPAFNAADRGVASAFIGDQNLRNLWFYGGGQEAAQNLGEQLEKTTAEVQAQQKGFMQDFKYAIKNEPQEIQSNIHQALNDAGADLHGANKNAYDTYQGQQLSFLSALAKDNSPGSIFKPMADDAEALIGKLRKSGTAVGEQKAQELENYLNAQRANVAREAGVAVDHPDLHELFAAGPEMKAAYDIRKIASSTKSSLSEDLQASVKEFHDNVSYMMHEQPEFGAQVQKLDNQYSAYRKISEFVSDKTGNLNKTTIDKLTSDPEYAHEFDAIMSKFPDTAPMLQNFKKAIEDPLQAQIHLNGIKQAIREAGAETYGRMGVDDYAKLGEMIGTGDLSEKADKLRQLQGALATGNDTPISKLVRNLQALGRPVPPIFEKLLPHQEGLEKVAKLVGGVEPTLVERMLTKMTRGVIKGSSFGLLAPILGSAVGHTMFHGPLGFAAGAAASAIGRRLFNPVSNIETLTKLQNGIKKGFSRLDGATQSAIDALTSKEAGRVAAAAGPKLSGWDDKQASYKSRMDYLTKLQNPEVLMQQTQDRFGTSKVAPNLTTAIHSQYAKTVQFLTSKMPQDPLAHQGLSANDSAYTPSDMEMAKFERYHAAAVDPVSAIKNIGALRATPQEVETLQTLYPSYYQRLQEGVLNAIMKPDIKLSYQQRVQIGSMFGVPSATSMRPDFVLAMQANFKNDKGQGPQPSGVKNNPKVAFDPQSQSTDVERITYQ